MNRPANLDVVTAVTGTVEEYLQALHKHNFDCETCAPSGLPNTNDGPLCDIGQRLRRGLSYARGREAGQTEAYL